MIVCGVRGVSFMINCLVVCTTLPFPGNRLETTKAENEIWMTNGWRVYLFMAKPGRAKLTQLHRGRSWNARHRILGGRMARRGESNKRDAPLYIKIRKEGTHILYQRIHLISYSTPHCQPLSSECVLTVCDGSKCCSLSSFTFKSAELLLDSSCLVGPFEPDWVTFAKRDCGADWRCMICALGPGTPLEIIQFKCKLFIFEITIGIRIRTNTRKTPNNNKQINIVPRIGGVRFVYHGIRYTA